MQSHAFLLGSHPSLSALEVHALVNRMDISAEFLPTLFPAALEIKGDSKPEEIFPLLGGTPLTVRMVGTIQELSAKSIVHMYPDVTQLLSGQKNPTISISWIPLSKHTQRVTRDDIREVNKDLKQILKNDIPRVRFILPKNGTACSTAQLYHADIPANGVAFILFGNSRTIHVGVVSAVQDIVSFAKRDREKPAADPGSGMLPPKVARMMINLSLVPPEGTIYDPFAGTGTIPMEACTMNVVPVASDISEKQVRRTEENLRWLKEAFPVTQEITQRARVFVCDIARHNPSINPASVDAVVTEGWLGPARTKSPTPSDIKNTFVLSEQMTRTMLKQVRPLLRKNGKVLCSVPAFRVKERIVRAPFLESFPIDPILPEQWNEWAHPIFRTARQGTLLYGRPDAIVLREIVRLDPFA